jgi:hypothetical protein
MKIQKAMGHEIYNYEPVFRSREVLESGGTDPNGIQLAPGIYPSLGARRKRPLLASDLPCGALPSKKI